MPLKKGKKKSGKKMAMDMAGMSKKQHDEAMKKTAKAQKGMMYK